MTTKHLKTSLTALALLVAMIGAPPTARAHCDSYDGPVIKAARAALEERDVNLVLVWVLPEEDEVIKRAFEQTLAVRQLNPEARELADRYFFETLVRIHRAGEGVAYTGLKPSGTDFGPSIPATDQALASEDIAPVMKLVSGKTERGVHERFQDLVARKDYDPKNIQAGRDYVKSYVEYTHYVKGIHDAAARETMGHFADAAAAPANDHPDTQ